MPPTLPLPCCLHLPTCRFPSPPPPSPTPARPLPVGGFVWPHVGRLDPHPPLLLNGIDGSCVDRARVRPLGTLVEHLMRDATRLAIRFAIRLPAGHAR